MRMINWGVLGPGAIANTFATAMKVSPKGKITAVASRSQERAEAFAKQYDIDNIYTNYEALLNDPSIDVIYIATPHSFHFEKAKQCLQAGKHVLVEKPCTVTAAQMQYLVDLAKANKVLLQEGVWSRFMPVLSQAKRSIEQGIIGDIQYIQSNIGFAFQNREQPKERLAKPELAGGALLDLGIYSISLSQYFLGEHPSVIQSTGKLTEQGVDEQEMVTLSYASGVYAQFSSSMAAHASNSMHIVGSQGYLVLPHCFWDADAAYFYKHDECIQAIEIPHAANGFEYEIAEVMDCIEQGKLYSDLMSHQDSISVLKIMDEIRAQLGVQYPESITQAR
ncbi:Gfo/Idh/MocA family oxidoreductase [uncultured Paraglaciecola sp.]|uniref:Gfo/Idh/MocA family protein n=1 Tax=uncultured Paraglaciecola sp. TaxID=1765024 RepID=UPI002597C69D|nr:Gfo/Idh/MocA family oxidoreductase [uncultured Paraglaciecola sp.]